MLLQRQTGGDLAEILDKIGSLIRERFKILGQVQALTGEGRLSGIVLLALPVVLFWRSTTSIPIRHRALHRPDGQEDCWPAAIVLQIVGALVIRKIVNIKV